MNWTEADLAAHLARKGVDELCTTLGKRQGKKVQQNRRQVARTGSEHEEQKALIAHCREMEAQYPDLALLHAIPNGGQRHAAVAKKLKAEGVRAGVPDLFLPVPRGKMHGLYIELKARGGTVSDNQRRMLRALEKQGYACVVAYGWVAAWDEIESYLKSAYVVPLAEVFGWAKGEKWPAK